MEENFDGLVLRLTNSSSLSIDDIKIINNALQTQTLNTIVSFLSKSLISFENLVRWTWQTLSEEKNISINDEYVKYFHILYNFYRQFILNNDQIENETKKKLFIPSNIESIDKILNQIESMNEIKLKLVNLAFDTISHFVHEYPDLVYFPLIIHLNQRLSQEYLMTNQYKSYLKQLTETNISTEKEKFYLNVSSFSLYVYLGAKSENFPFNGEQIVRFLGEDYCQMIVVQSQRISQWTNELLSTISRLIAFICAACWWGGEKSKNIEILISNSDQMLNSLIRIVSYEPFYSKISNSFYTDETLLIDASLIFLFGIVETLNLNCFINAKTTLSSTLLKIGQISSYDRIRICAYGFLAEILSNEQLKELQLVDNLCEFFFTILEQACQNPTKKWKKIPIPYLLKGIKENFCYCFFFSEFYLLRF